MSIAAIVRANGVSDPPLIEFERDFVADMMGAFENKQGAGEPGSPRLLLGESRDVAITPITPITPMGRMLKLNVGLMARLGQRHAGEWLSIDERGREGASH